MKEKVSVRTSMDLKPGRIVRRYLDLPKYLDMLRTHALYLRRADGFTDRFEGALTPGIRQSLDGAYRAKQIDHDAEYFYRRSRGGSYVSCWSLGAQDNMALWQLYGGVTASLAVTSTVDRLIDMAMRWKREQDVLIYRVRYIDHFKNPDMIIGSYTDLLEFKHEAYEYEQEVRIIVPQQGEDWGQNPPYIRLPTGDLNRVIRSVVVAPESEDWSFDLVQDVTRKYGVSSPVRRSKIAFLP